jgi:hypothetical protein
MSNVFKKFLKGDPVGLMKQGGDSLGRRVLGEKTFGRLNKFDPMGAQFESFGHDARLGDNILGGESVSDSFRQRGREDMLGLRAREVGAGALMAVGGYYAAPYLAGGSGVGYGGTTSASAAPSASASGFSPFTTQMGYSGSTVGSGTSVASSSWRDNVPRQLPQQGGGGSEYQQEEYDNSAYQDQMQYWTGRAMELREMADQAVRKYYS